MWSARNDNPDLQEAQSGCAIYKTPFSKVRLEWQADAITSLELLTWDYEAVQDRRNYRYETRGHAQPELCFVDPERRHTKLTDLAAEQLNEYFEGKRREFTVPLAKQHGTEFQQSVWEALTRIPYGETRTYGQVAHMIGRPKAVRAVGGANNANHLPIFIPCHRVVGVHGPVGYAFGLDMKQRLLDLEAGHLA